MKKSVRAAFVGFTVPLEGLVTWFYADVKHLITIGIGNLCDPISTALTLPLVRPDGSDASRDEIAAEWNRVKARCCMRTDAKHDAGCVAYLGHRSTEAITSLRLTPAGVDQVVLGRLDLNDALLLRRFPDFEDWPADAQLATHSMAWACGPAFNFPRLAEALRARDFARAAAECHMDERNNHGLAPRNIANKRMYRNAARSMAWHLDPDELHWPAELEDSVPTQPELPAAEPVDEPDEVPRCRVHEDCLRYPELGRECFLRAREPDGGESRWRATSEAVVDAVRDLVTKRSGEDD